MDKESHRSHQNQMLQKVHELGQWPPRHLEPHLGPNLELSVAIHAFSIFLIEFHFIFIICTSYYILKNMAISQMYDNIIKFNYGNHEFDMID